MTTGVVVVTTPGQTLSEPIITNTTVRDGNGVYVNGNGASVTGANVAISTTGTPFSNGLSAAVRVANGSFELEGGTVSTSGTRFTRGLLATSDTAFITTRDVAISTLLLSSTLDSHAVHALAGGTIDLTGGSVATLGGRSYALYSQNAGSLIKATNVAISTGATNAVYADDGAAIQLTGGSVEVTGAVTHAVVAGAGSTVTVNGTSINAVGDRSRGLLANAAGASIIATNATIVTHERIGYGAHATGAGTSITLNGGSITTLIDTGRESEVPTSPRAYALLADNGGSIEASNLSIVTYGQRSYGAHALSGGTVDLDAVNIVTNGVMGYGLYAGDAGSVVNATNVNVTTVGNVGTAAWAYEGGQLNIVGGTFHVQGGPDASRPTRGGNGFAAMGGVNNPSPAIIDASNVNLITEGAYSLGLQLGGVDGSERFAGGIRLADSAVTVNGANALIAHVGYGSVLAVTDSVLTATQGSGIRMVDEATVFLTGTTVSAAGESFISRFTTAGQSQILYLGEGTVATANNGTLLLVTREGAGGDGVVNLVLAEGSQTVGNIVDLGEKTGGGTDVTLGAGADWIGQMFGVRNVFAAPGGTVNFEGEAFIAGDLSGEGTSYFFSPQGGTIGGNVSLQSGSRTTGGSVDTPINVGGNVSVDETSIFGGNWNIGGDVASAGTITPGNSIGRVTIGGNLTLAPSSVYAVEIDASGNADRVDVGGTALLAGAVTVTPLGGYLIGMPYTILTAGSLAGTSFDSVSFSDSFAFLTPQLSYGASDVLLTIGRNDVRYASVARTANQMATANALDSLALTSTLGSAAAFLTTAAAPVTFDQLSGEVHALAQSVFMEQSSLIRGALVDRLRAAQGGVGASAGTVVNVVETSTGALAYAAPSKVQVAADMSMPVKAAPVGAPVERFSLWTTGFGNWGSFDGNANASGINDSTGGFLIGADTLVGSGWRVGVAGGYSYSDFSSAGRNASGSSDNWHAGLYAGNVWGQLALRTGLSYTWQDVSTSRQVGFTGFFDSLSADYDTGTFQAFGELGWRIDTAFASFEPFANLAYVSLDTSGYFEQGGAAALFSDGSDMDTTFSTLGLRASKEIALGSYDATLRGLIGWRHAFGDITPSITQAFLTSDAFTVTGVPIAEDAAVIEAGLDVRVGEATTLGISYTGQFGGGVTQNGFNASLKVSF